MSVDQTVDVGRLALREEGEFWNAYYARPDTMVGAVLLGSIRMSIVASNEKHKRAFMACMIGFVDEMMEDITGQKVARWRETLAPESERTSE